MTMETIISITATIISLTAIILTIVQIYIQREHNFKSVKPIGQVSVADYETDVHVALTNGGIGPLIITDIKVYNKDVTSTNLLKVLPNDLVQSMIWTDFVTELKGRAIQNGEEVFLIRAMFDDDLTEELINFRTRLRECLKYITVEFTYTDIYEKNTYHTKRELTWFGRT